MHLFIVLVDFARRNPLPLIIIGVTAALLSLFWLLQPAPPKDETGTKRWPVQTVRITEQTHIPQLQLLGQVETPLNTQLTAPVTAEVLALPHLEGESVKQGQSVVELDDRDAALLLAQREADLAELQAQLAQERNRIEADRKALERQEELVQLARAAVAREEKLKRSDLTSQARLDDTRRELASARLALNTQALEVSNAEARIAALEARLKRARSLRDQAKLDLERLQMPAPFAGIITGISVSPGERLRAGDPVAELYADGRLEVRAQLPSRHVGRVREALRQGQTLSAMAFWADREQALELTRLAGAVNQGAGGVDGLFRFRTAVDAPLGQALEVRVNMPAAEDSFSVPISALYGTNQLFRVVDGRLDAVNVTVIGNRFTEEGQHLLVRSPLLETGDEIITTQLPNAIEGLEVEVRGRSGEAGETAS